jgi:membrane-associated phospholipid phosphatase
LSSEDTGVNKPVIRFRPLDIATLAYIAIEFVIVLIFMTGRPGWAYFLLFYLVAAGIVILIVLFDMAASGLFWKALRLVYPLFLFAFLYEAVGPQVFLIFDHSFDAHVIALEKTIFGVDPAFALQQHMEIWLNELMNASYFSYYFMLPVSAIVLLVTKNWDALEKLVLTSAVTFYVCYLIFIFYPVVGPRFFLSEQYYLPIIGPCFTPLTQRIIAGGGLYGGAMPSSHCAVALVSLWILAREVRKTAIPSFILVSMLCASTVYGRYHYISDVVAGLLIGAAMLRLAGSWHRKFIARIQKLTSVKSL